MRLLVLACLLTSALAAPRLRNDPLGTYIVNGQDAFEGQFPWQAYLSTSPSSYCGGVFIGGKWVLTAGHCVYGKSLSTFHVYLGMHEFFQGDYQAYNPTRLIKHPNYNPDGLINDIAIVELPHVITETRNIQGANLPADGQDHSGHNCVISGWGYTSNSPPSWPNFLQYTPTYLMNNEDCRKIWGSNVKDYTLCVYNGHSGPCFGDSGGPVSCGSTVVGVFSWMEINCNADYPSGYVRVSYYREWIRDITGI